ncbi:MAG TPA: hypothetical protein VJ276_16225 [Thermoanaerobaculia bacterium]|nr:hypothetical protein [Thermoanaerobaculia bacterium]
MSNSARAWRFGAAILLLTALAAVAQPPPRRDGNWWRTLDRLHQIAFALGLLDGINVGGNLSWWETYETDPSDPCIKKARISHDDYVRRYLEDVSSVQIRDGLTKFYADYRNRRIPVERAVWLVLNEIAGTPADQLREMIENTRRNSQ